MGCGCRSGDTPQTGDAGAGPRRQAGRRALPWLLPFAGPILSKTNRAAAPASPCNDSATVKFNIPQ